MLLATVHPKKGETNTTTTPCMLILPLSAFIDGHDGSQRPAVPPDQTVSVNVSHGHRGALRFSSRASGGRKTDRPRYAGACAFNWTMGFLRDVETKPTLGLGEVEVDPELCSRC